MQNRVGMLGWMADYHRHVAYIYVEPHLVRTEEGKVFFSFKLNGRWYGIEGGNIDVSDRGCYLKLDPTLGTLTKKFHCVKVTRIIFKLWRLWGVRTVEKCAQLREMIDQHGPLYQACCVVIHRCVGKNRLSMVDYRDGLDCGQLSN